MFTSLNFIGPVAPDKDAFLGDRIRNEHAKRMIQIFKANHDGDPLKTFAVKFTTDDLAELNKLIAETTGANGFAVYYSTYPIDGSLNPAGRYYNGRNTIIFIPTINGVPVVNPYESYEVKGDKDAYNHGELNP